MARLTIGVIGLGRMGLSIAYRLVTAGHNVVGFDESGAMCAQAQKIGVRTVEHLTDVAQKVRIFWLMVPAGDATDHVITQLLPTLQAGDIVIDGGNSNFHDSIRRYNLLAAKSISFLDCGTSGGLHGKQLGFSLMIGGDKEAFDRASEVFEAVAATGGYAYLGPAGAGHYVKMVHNGIEYALLQAYAEGFHVLKEGSYKNLDLERVADVWNNGSIVRSWILELAHNVFAKDQQLTNISGAIGENLTGRWTVDEAHARNIPIDLIERSLEIRAESRQTGGNYATKVVALLRNQFGGHAVEKKGDK